MSRFYFERWEVLKSKCCARLEEQVRDEKPTELRRRLDSCWVPNGSEGDDDGGERERRARAAGGFAREVEPLDDQPQPLALGLPWVRTTYTTCLHHTEPSYFYATPPCLPPPGRPADRPRPLSSSLSSLTKCA